MSARDRTNAFDSERQWAKQCTDDFRMSQASAWQRLRERLREEGGRPMDAAVAHYGPDGGGLASGLLVSRDGRLFEFTLALGAKGKGQELDLSHD